MAVTYTNVWQNIIKALSAKIKAEAKCPVLDKFGDESKANTFIRLILTGSTQDELSSKHEQRTYNITIEYFMLRRKNAQFQQAFTERVSKLQTHIGRNPTMTLSDSTIAFNLQAGDLDFNADVEDEFEDYEVARWEFNCKHKYYF